MPEFISDSKQTDKELLEKMLQQNQEAFNLFYKRHVQWMWSKVVGALRRYGKECDADDVVQKIWIDICEKMDKIKITESDSAKPSLTAYTKIGVQAYWREYFRRLNVEIPMEESAEVHMAMSGYANAESLIEIKEIERRLDKVIQRYPEIVRQSFILRKQEGLSYDEIGRILKIAPQTVKNNVSMIVNVLKYELGDYRLSALLLLYGKQWIEHFIR